MERNPLANYLESTETTDESESEKLKKSRKFIGWVRLFAKSKTEKDQDEPGRKEDEGSILEIIHLFKVAEENNELDELDKPSEPQAIEEIKEYLTILYDETLDILSNDSSSQTEKDSAYIDALLLQKISRQLENEDSIDIDEILLETAQELAGEQPEREPRELFLKNNEIKEVNNRTLLSTHNSPEPNQASAPDRPKTHTSSNEASFNSSRPSEVVSETAPIDESPREKIMVEQTSPDINNEHPSLSAGSSDLKNERVKPAVPAPENHPRAKVSVPNKHQPEKPQHIQGERFIHEGGKVEQANKPLNKTNQESDLAYGSLLQLAEKTYINGLNLRRIYEISDLNIDDLRNILAARDNKKGLEKLVKKTLKRRKNSFENIASILKHTKKPTPTGLIAGRGYGMNSYASNNSVQQASSTSSNDRLKQEPSGKKNSLQQAGPFIAFILLLLIMLVALVLFYIF